MRARLTFGVSLAALILAACGSGPDSPSETTVQCPLPAAPTADPGGDQAVFHNETVRLDGTQSHDAKGGAVTFAWSATDPAGAPITLQNADTARASFPAPTSGDYHVRLTVTDGCGASASATATISASNRAPTANAGAPHWVGTEMAGALDGSASLDPDGDPLRYSWTVVSAPTLAGNFALDSVESPPFTAHVPGTYVFSLVVSDGVAQSAPATVTVDAETPPVASAGADRVVEQRGLASVDGSGSQSPSGDPLTFQWSLAAPTGSHATLSDPTAVAPTFVADLAGTYRLTLTVNDGRVAVTDEALVVAEKTIHPLDVTVVDAEYSASRDRLVVVGINPDRLYEVNPFDGTSASLDLDEAPLSVSVSPDGSKAIVGQADELTYVDLSTTSQIGATYPITCSAGDVVLADQDAYVFPASGQWVQIHTVRLSDGQETLGGDNSLYSGVHARLHPSGTRLYGSDTQLSPSRIQRMDVDVTGVARVSPVDQFAAGCGNVWFTEDGFDILTACGDVRNASDNPDEDMTLRGTFQDGSGNPPPYLLSVSASASAGEVAAIPEGSYDGSDTDQILERYDLDTFVIKGKTELPRFVIGDAAYPSHGRFVFHSRDGAHVIVLVKADAAAGLQANHGIVVY